MVNGSTSGERIRLEGRVFDGEGQPVSDAMIEIWQADAAGRYRHPSDAGPPASDEDFIGFGRSGTDADGRFAFETVKPGSVPGQEEDRQSPHLNVLVFARGLLDRLATRAYFDDDGPIETDPFLLSLPQERRATLVARREPDTSPPVYRYDVVLQGDAETVFFDA